MDQERWRRLSFREQMGHITSEIVRAAHWEERNDLESRSQSIGRALDLIDRSLDCHRGPRCRELARLREALSSCFTEPPVYDIALSDLQRYGLSFLVVS